MRAQRGFTLIELMIAVVIVGILVAVALPAYNDQVRKTRRAEGKAMLQQVMNHQERYYTSNNAYDDDLTELDAYDNDPVESAEGWYNVSAAYCTAGDDQCVQLTATPQNDQANDTCGNLTLTSRGQRGESGSGDCW